MPALKDAILNHLTYSVGTNPDRASDGDWRVALSYAVRDRMVDSWQASEKAAHGAKHVYYLSMEFLIGRLLEDGIINLQLLDEAQGAFQGMGVSFQNVVHDEPDAALGNGGLGRLAACFLESLSTLGCPAMGYGIRYEHGLFQQAIEEGRQTEAPETWLASGNPWEFQRPNLRFAVGFGGAVAEAGTSAKWSPAEQVMAQAHDVPVVGWQGRFTNTLRLWSGEAVNSFDLARFNAGDYAGAALPEAEARCLSRVLYPDDTTDQGKALRLKQEYFFTAASLADILGRHMAQGNDLSALPSKVAIQLNDTHPAIAGPELVRLLHDVHGLSFSDAVAIARGTLNYTNHTLLPEALESWSEGLVGSLLPRHLALIDRIDDLHAKENPTRKVTARDHGQVKMGELSFMMAQRVNGVSALHTDLMKSTVFSELHRLHPEKIINQTNGVTPRRWMLNCNPRLSSLITDAIGDAWVGDLDQLQKLEEFADDASFLEGFAAAKEANKAELSAYVKDAHGLSFDPSWMFDIQIKRMHEYKRQHLNILEAIALWQAMRENPKADWTPRVKIFAGKAAPGYFFAKDIIRLINDVAHVVNADPATRDRLQIAFLPNYNVTLAERLIPAADLSEQISTAGKEASGTGNMKFAMNGALTIGTLDGANVEIREAVGAENFFLFGMTAEEVMARREVEGHAAKAIAADPRLSRALATIRDGLWSPGEPDRYTHIADNLAGPDYFLVSSDFTDFWRAQREADQVYADQGQWVRKALLNTARSGWFSSDRTIQGYMNDIWGAASVL